MSSMIMNITASEIRRWNARFLANEDGSMTAFADKLDKGLSQIGQLIGINNTKNIGNKIARQIESAYGKEKGWLDVPHVSDWQSIDRVEWQEAYKKEWQKNGLTPSEAGDFSVNEEGSFYLEGDSDVVLVLIDEAHRSLNDTYLSMDKEAREQLLSLAKMLADKHPDAIGLTGTRTASFKEEKSSSKKKVRGPVLHRGCRS